jgi:8-amino-7-oxononanoate synthase
LPSHCCDSIHRRTPKHTSTRFESGALPPPTAIVPVLCETDESFQLTRTCQEQDVFVLPVVSPAVPEGLARLRATVIAAHEPAEIERAVDVIGTAGKQLGII